MIILEPSKEFRFPIVAECICPDVFQGKKAHEIGELKVWEGNKQGKLGELFKIEEAEATVPIENASIKINGDVDKVRRIGAKMRSGNIIINGDVGMHLGEEMTDGKITVNGNTDAWTGSMMKGGTIDVHGSTGDYLAAPYRGSTKGMHGGTIIVHGNTGNEAGAYMKKGIVKIRGNAGQFVGIRMHDGVIYVQGDCDERAGACMTDGKIIIGGKLQSILPTFTVESIKPRVKIDENETAQGPFYLFLGDLAEGGKGKVYVSKQKNSQLGPYEKFL